MGSNFIWHTLTVEASDDLRFRGQEEPLLFTEVIAQQAFVVENHGTAAVRVDYCAVVVAAPSDLVAGAVRVGLQRPAEADRVGRTTLDDDAGLVTFGPELGGDHHQVSNWALPPRYRQRPTTYRGALAKLYQVRFQILAANPDRLLCEDRRPESRDLHIGAERRKQVPGRRGRSLRPFTDETVSGKPDASRGVPQLLFKLRKTKPLVSILHSISAVSPFANARASSWTNCSRSRIMVFSSSLSSVLMTRFLVFQAATCGRSPEPNLPFKSPAVERPMCPLCKGVSGLVLRHGDLPPQAHFAS